MDPPGQHQWILKEASLFIWHFSCAACGQSNLARVPAWWAHRIPWCPPSHPSHRAFSMTQILPSLRPHPYVLENLGVTFHVSNCSLVSNFFFLIINPSLYYILEVHAREYVNGILPCLAMLVQFSKICVFLYDIVNINENFIWCSQIHRLCLLAWMEAGRHFQNLMNRIDNG